MPDWLLCWVRLDGLLILITAATVFDGGLLQVSQTILADDAEAAMPFGTMGMVTCIGCENLLGVTRCRRACFAVGLLEDIQRLCPVSRNGRNGLLPGFSDRLGMDDVWHLARWCVIGGHLRCGISAFRIHRRGRGGLRSSRSRGAAGARFAANAPPHT